MNRSFVIMAGAAVVLVALVLLFANPFQDSIRKDNPKVTQLFDPELVARADKVAIDTGTDNTVIEKKDDQWVVSTRNDFPADTSAVGNLLRAVEKGRSQGIASTNPDKRGLFQVDSTGVHVTVSAGGKTAADFVLGKMGRDFTTSYVLPAGSKNVVLVRGMNRNLFARPRGFRDATLLHFEPDAVAGVTVSSPDVNWDLTRTDSTWTVTLPGQSAVAADQQKVDQTLRSLGTFTADGFVDHPDTVDTGLADPEMKVTVRMMTGPSTTISVGKKNDRNQRYVSRPDRDAVYEVGQWRIDNFAKQGEDLVKKAKAPAAPAGASAPPIHVQGTKPK
jgi:hypothetical protein